MDLIFNKTMIVLLTIFAVILTVDYILGTLVAKKSNLYSSEKGNEGLMKKFIAFILFIVVVLVIDFADLFNLPTIEEYLNLMKITLPVTIMAYGRKELSSIIANLSIIYEFDVGEFFSKSLSADQELRSKQRKIENTKYIEKDIEIEVIDKNGKGIDNDCK
ncbi:phage holin family protein [Floricoccus penangensis]|uniref:phage holin family protein n=1 Tax=Floricoccus penangensis TaxID=1859475 RepID=UPI00203AD6E3|nr:phage holin family protein [Floricoccus penangensis]URZ87057.1 phage holin family protein [Floricoccus penangensis]